MARRSQTEEDNESPDFEIDSPNDNNYLSRQLNERPQLLQSQNNEIDALSSRKKNNQKTNSIHTSSIFEICPNFENPNEVIVDFVIIDQENFNEAILKVQAEEEKLNNDLKIVFSTTNNDIYIQNLVGPVTKADSSSQKNQNQINTELKPKNMQQSSEKEMEPLLIFSAKQSKAIVEDHYLSMLGYLQQPSDFLFIVSKLRPDVAWATQLQEQKEKQNTQKQQHAGYGNNQSASQQARSSVQESFQIPNFAYPFHNLKDHLEQMNQLKDDKYQSNQDQDNHPIINESTIAQIFKGYKVKIPSIGQDTFPKTVGQVFSQEWKDLMKFIAVTNGSTKMPIGIEPMTYRPTNLPQMTEEEQKRVNQLVEDNRREYIQKQREKQEAANRKQQERQAFEEKQAQIWQTEIFPNWDSLKSTVRVRELWTAGIPGRIRAFVWYKAIGNKSVITKDLFNIMAERGRNMYELLEKFIQCETRIIENGGRPQDVELKIQKLKSAADDQQS